MQGQLGEKLVPDLIREIVQKNLSGLLRMSRGKAIKAIFFDSGAPTFAISNLTNEQLDYKVIHEDLVTPHQVELAKEKAGKTQRLGPVLVEMGILEDTQMRKLVCDQVMGIILSVFEWTQGDFTFDERIRASHEVTLDLGAADVLLLGARHVADIPQVASLLVPDDAVVLRPRTAPRSDSGQLIPLESYILSRIESPTSVNEVGTLSGLGEADAHRAVCALVAAGFLKLLDHDKEEEGDAAAREAEESLERLREEVIRKLHFFTTADYYEVLGVTRHATTAEIKAAYYHLAKKYHPDRYHQHDTGDLRSKLEGLFAMVTQAYDKLSQPAERAAYDEKLRRTSGSLPSNPRPATPAGGPDSNQSDPHLTDDANGAGHVHQNNSDSLPPVAADTPVPETIINSGKATPNLPPAQMAEVYYQQGRARFERKEYHAAVHLLREAIKLDPSRAPYHYHLGIALIRNPRTRRDAEQHLSKAAELEPYNSQIRVKLGLLYKEAGLNKRAEHFFKEALQMDPDNKVAKRELQGGGKGSKAVNGGSIWKSDMGSIAKKIFKK